MILLQKLYTIENIPDAIRDIHEAFEPKINPEIEKIPVDKYGLLKGTFEVILRWKR